MSYQETEFAKVAWRISDITDAYRHEDGSDISAEEAEEFLLKNGGRIQERMCQVGYEAIETLVSMDGLDWESC